MQRYSGILIALVALLALTACSGTAASEPSPTPVSDETASTTDSVEVEEAASSDESSDSANSAPTGDAARGQELFATTCSVCHGPEGKGVQGLGKDMTTSEFIAERSDQGLLEFVKVGRPPDDPLNTTGVLMPPRGGNSSLSDEDLMDIIAFIRTIHE